MGNRVLFKENAGSGLISIKKHVCVRQASCMLNHSQTGGGVEILMQSMAAYMQRGFYNALAASRIILLHY